MPNYRYKGSECGAYCERFVRGFKSREEDDNHGAQCDCGAETCFLSRSISKPQQPMGFKEFAGDWYKKTYGHEMGERDTAYAEKQKAIDEEAKKLIREYGINAQAKAVEKND